MPGHFETLLEGGRRPRPPALGAAPAHRRRAQQLLARVERHGRATRGRDPASTLFEAQARARPDAVAAVVFEGERAHLPRARRARQPARPPPARPRASGPSVPGRRLPGALARAGRRPARHPQGRRRLRPARPRLPRRAPRLHAGGRRPRRPAHPPSARHAPGRSPRSTVLLPRRRTGHRRPRTAAPGEREVPRPTTSPTSSTPPARPGKPRRRAPDGSLRRRRPTGRRWTLGLGFDVSVWELSGRSLAGASVHRARATALVARADLGRRGDRASASITRALLPTPLLPSPARADAGRSGGCSGLTAERDSPERLAGRAGAGLQPLRPDRERRRAT